MRLALVSAGAAQGLVEKVGALEGIETRGSFGAVGAMIARYRAGEACDVLILTQAQVRELEDEGALLAGSARDLGRVATAVAVRAADRRPDVSSAGGLRAALLAADAIYFPDPAKATAGIHFQGVLDKLGIASQVAARVRNFPNGATSMREMAQAAGHPLGCTQATEILATPGVALVAPLPEGLGLETTYTAAVNTRAANPEAARQFVAALAGEKHAALRRECGFR